MYNVRHAQRIKIKTCIKTRFTLGIQTPKMERVSLSQKKKKLVWGYFFDDEEPLQGRATSCTHPC